MASKLKLTELLYPTSTTAAITINSDDSVTIPTQSTTNLAYTGTLTGGTGVVNLGSGQLYKDASGNVGIGVTPSAWAVAKALQINARSSLFAFGNDSHVGYNAYYGDTYRYIASDFASRYTQTAGQHQWYTAPSGTAGNIISFTQAMTLNSSGNVGIGTGTTSNVRLTSIAATASWAGTFYANSGGASTTGLNEYGLSFGGNYSGGSAEVNIVYGSAGAGLDFSSYNGTTVTPRMRINSSGNVQIGTSDDSARLTISGAAGYAGTGISLFETSATARRLRMYQSTGGVIYDATFGSGDNAHLWYIGGGEKARIDTSGNLLVGTQSAAAISSSPSYNAKARFYGGVTSVATGASNDNSLAFAVESNGNTAPFLVYTSANGTANAAAATVKVQFNGSTGRSINATGTINASGADYAEYMTKASDFVVAKGDIVGINFDGKITNVFADAVSFCVKSTSPSYVGGDTWGAGFEDDPDGLEVARQLVDRIAFAGQVPVNVMNAIPGQFIIPINDGGAIKGEAVSNPTFEQYQIAVGKVIAIESDGRARIIVKVA
jgi:hypothetical protein